MSYGHDTLYGIEKIIATAICRYLKCKFIENITEFRANLRDTEISNIYYFKFHGKFVISNSPPILLKLITRNNFLGCSSSLGI